MDTAQNINGFAADTVVPLLAGQPPRPIRLVASDLDGTLLQYGHQTLDGKIFTIISKLAARGIRFCPASGRQYTSLKKLFAPVAADCVFLCENGGVVFWNDKPIAKTPMPRALAEEIAADLWEGSAGRGEVMLSGENTSYLMVRGPEGAGGLGMETRIRTIGNHLRVVRTPAEIPEDILKVSLYLPGGTAEFESRFIPRWKDANAAVAGPYWIDTTLANKGTALQSLCQSFGFSPQSVLAFGDNYNDEAMLDLAGVPCIMSSAAPALRARYPLQAACPEDLLCALLAQP